MQSPATAASLVVMTSIRQPGLRLEGLRFLKDILWLFEEAKHPKGGNPKALYKNQIAHSGLDENMPIY